MKPKACPFCSNNITHIDYKQFEYLKKYTTGFGKIETRKRTKVCSYHQRGLGKAIKRARHMALMPFVVQ
ncbi:MAG: 30S ribosomal protein S18 [Patescibacteria group bacterium]